VHHKINEVIEIRTASENDITVLALLGRVSYVESHGHFIEDKNDLNIFVNKAFSVSTTRQEFERPNVVFYIMYSDDFPIAYAKMIKHSKSELITEDSSCQLERLYILNEFIPLKVGQQLMDFLIAKAKEFNQDSIWLTVYIKNLRAINFYKKNEFSEVGFYDFLVNGKVYENYVMKKKF